MFKKDKLFTPVDALSILVLILAGSFMTWVVKIVSPPKIPRQPQTVETVGNFSFIRLSPGKPYYSPDFDQFISRMMEEFKSKHPEWEVIGFQLSFEEGWKDKERTVTIVCIEHQPRAPTSQPSSSTEETQIFEGEEK